MGMQGKLRKFIAWSTIYVTAAAMEPEFHSLVDRATYYTPPQI